MIFEILKFKKGCNHIYIYNHICSKNENGRKRYKVYLVIIFKNKSVKQFLKTIL